MDLERMRYDVNKLFFQMLLNNNIRDLDMVSFGNSISNGYGVFINTCPWFFRNGGLISTEDCDLSLYNFSLPQRNSEARLYEMMLDNVTQSKINLLNRNCYIKDLRNCIPNNGISDKIDEYFPLLVNDDKGIMDIIRSGKKVILIYNGCTSSFIEEFFNKKGFRNFAAAFSNDLRGYECILKLIEYENRRGANVQVYFGGFQNYFGVRLGEIVNFELKKISKRYVNVTYVNPILTNPFFKTGKYKISFDVHLRDAEHIKLGCEFMNKMVDNFVLRDVLISVDRVLYNLHQFLQGDGIEFMNDNVFVKDYVMNHLSEELNRLSLEDFNKFEVIFKKRIRKFGVNDYYFANLDVTNDVISDYGKKLKR